MCNYDNYYTVTHITYYVFGLLLQKKIRKFHPRTPQLWGLDPPLHTYIYGLSHPYVVHVAARVVSLSYLLLYLCFCDADSYMLLRCFVVLLTRAPFCADMISSTPLFVLMRAPLSDIMFPFAMSVVSSPVVS